MWMYVGCLVEFDNEVVEECFSWNALLEPHITEAKFNLNLYDWLIIRFTDKNTANLCDSQGLHINIV